MSLEKEEGDQQGEEIPLTSLGMCPSERGLPWHALRNAFTEVRRRNGPTTHMKMVPSRSFVERRKREARDSS